MHVQDLRANSPVLGDLIEGSSERITRRDSVNKGRFNFLLRMRRSLAAPHFASDKNFRRECRLINILPHVSFLLHPSFRATCSWWNWRSGFSSDNLSYLHFQKKKSQSVRL